MSDYFCHFQKPQLKTQDLFLFMWLPSANQLAHIHDSKMLVFLFHSVHMLSWSLWFVTISTSLELNFVTRLCTLHQKCPSHKTNPNSQFKCQLQFFLCRFSVIPSVVYELQKLEILFVNGNRIEEVDVERLQKMPVLTTFNLQNNNINQVPPELALIPKLTWVNFCFSNFLTILLLNIYILIVFLIAQTLSYL